MQSALKNSTIREKNKQLINKCAKDLNRHLIKEDTQLGNKHLYDDRYPMSLENYKFKQQRNSTAHLLE